MRQRRKSSKIQKKNKSNSQTNRKEKNLYNAANTILKLVAFIYVVITIMFYISVMKLDMLPGIYVTIFTMAEILFTCAMGVGLVKKRKTLRLNILCLIIVVIVSIIYINAIRYLTATSDFLGNAFKEVEETEEYYIVVKKDSSYNKIEDLENKEIYAFQVEKDVESDVENKKDIKLKKGDSLTELGNNLINKKIQAILIGSSQYAMLDDEIKDFKTNTKIIYTITHKLEKTEIEDKNSEQKINNGIFNVYVSGIDTYGKISNVSRSDANIVATVNTNTHEVLLTSIPRDYYVTLHSKHAKDKLTHSGIYGIKETVTTVEDLLDIDINYYVRVNFSTVIKLVDTIGGIDVYSDYNFSTNTNPSYSFVKGNNHLDGDKALAFSRERYSFASGDNQRVKNQQKVIEAVIKKVTKGTTILNKYTDILESMKGSFQTNVEQSEISSLVKDQIQTMASWKVKSYALTGSGSSGPTYSMGSQKLYIMIPNSSSVNTAKEKIKEVMDKKN